MSLMEETINKLKSEIERYLDFSDDDKEIWKARIEFMPPEYALFLLGLFEKSPQDIAWLNKNIKEKEEILESRDKNKWRALLEEEKKYLEKLSKE